MAVVKLLAFLLLQPTGGETVICPNSSATGATKPLYLLTLATIPSRLGSLSGAQIARDEVNNRTDLLPGYHIELIVPSMEECSSFEAGIGLSNLVKYTVSPPCHPVVAVIGLPCSSHTLLLSPVAGHDGYDLMQLSEANAPIFQSQINRFPHLWHFLGPATVYTEAIQLMMDQYNWSRIGVIFAEDSVFFSGIAKHLNQLLCSVNKSVEFSVGIRATKYYYIDSAISYIKTKNVSIIASLLYPTQEHALQTRAIKENLLYPDYVWIHVERSPPHLDAKQGHIYLHTQLRLNPNTVLVSGKTFAEFEEKNRDFIHLEQHYNLTPSAFASYWYDQVWAIALAVNNSLPVLENRNLSIDNYTIGQHEITDVIEEQMANLSFQGAGGWVEFNQYHSVSTPVEVFWILDNGTGKQVGVYNPLNPTDFHVDINSSDLPNDTTPNIVVILIPPPVTILLYILTGVVIMFTTVQLILYLYYRNHKVIKATSSCLSLLMFAGCYLFCIAAVSIITYTSFILRPIDYTILIYTCLLSAINAVSLLVITLFIKLLRVYQIFHLASHIKKGQKYLKTCYLFLFISLLSAIPNIIIFPSLILEAPALIQIYKELIEFHREVHIHNLMFNFKITISISLVLAYLAVFVLLTCFLAFRTRKISYKNFKNTKKINIFIGILFLTITLGGAMSAILIIGHHKKIGREILSVCLLILPTVSQLLLFLPKILPVVCSSRLKTKLDNSKLGDSLHDLLN